MSLSPANIRKQIFRRRLLVNRTERLYKIDHLLQERQVVSVKNFLEVLGVSLATFKRDLAYLRDRLNAPVVWDREAGGYRFDKQGAGDKYELPGLWFSAQEIQALLMMQELLKNLGPGLLASQVAPLQSRLRLLLEQDGIPASDVEKRIRLARTNARAYEADNFAPLAASVLQRRRVVLDHHSKRTDEVTRREVSPARLTFYRDNWYLDGYCHMRKALRSFGLDAIRCVDLTEKPAQEICDDELAATLDAGYGIFAGKSVEWAELVFTPERARWVSREAWHRDQEGWFDDDGAYHLKVPYSDPTELVMDVMKHGPDVRVVSPEALRNLVVQKLREALQAVAERPGLLPTVI
jgi:predicted DNA-binding transcriptional regulator YafY